MHFMLILLFYFQDFFFFFSWINFFFEIKMLIQIFLLATKLNEIF